MKILLIRHGETTGDIEDRYGGSYDDHLTEKGREQLTLTAHSLVGMNIEMILYSPLIRAREAAQIISEVTGYPLSQCEGLEERDYGVLTGLTKQEALEQYPEAVELHKNPMNTDPEGESFEDFNARVVATFERIRTEPYTAIAIVAHGGSIKRILNHIGAPIPDTIGDGGVIEVEV